MSPSSCRTTIKIYLKKEKPATFNVAGFFYNHSLFYDQFFYKCPTWRTDLRHIHTGRQIDQDGRISTDVTTEKFIATNAVNLQLAACNS